MFTTQKQHHKQKTFQDDNLAGIRPHRNTTLGKQRLKEGYTERQPQSKKHANEAISEISTALCCLSL